jgi:hypothetical protein
MVDRPTVVNVVVHSPAKHKVCGGHYSIAWEIVSLEIVCAELAL